MPARAWSSKRERQYEHIKGSAKKRGAGEDRAEEIAARTVNKNRAQSGESRCGTPLRSVVAGSVRVSPGPAAGRSNSSTGRRAAATSRDARR